MRECSSGRGLLICEELWHLDSIQMCAQSHEVFLVVDMSICVYKADSVVEGKDILVSYANWTTLKTKLES